MCVVIRGTYFLRGPVEKVQSECVCLSLPDRLGHMTHDEGRHLLVYHPSITLAETNVLENMWRQRVRCCVAMSRGSLLQNLIRYTPLPYELWTLILSYSDAHLPRPVCDLRHVGDNTTGRIFRVEEVVA